MSSLPSDIERYHHYVATLPCAHCGVIGYSQVAHYQGMSGSQLSRGMSLKADDLTVCPLCTEMGNDCHGLADDYKLFATFDDRFMNKLSHSEGMLVYAQRTLIRAYAAGVLTFPIRKQTIT